MLLANESVAKHLSKAKLPTLYRLHESPPVEKLADLHHFLGDFRLQLNGGDEPKATDYAALIAQIQDHPNKDLIETVLLRSMAQATYSPKEGGHFGLSYEHYLHFTSPIRRYPDLMVHRGLKYLIANKGKKGDWAWTEPQLEQMGIHCSTTERRADEAVRDATTWLKCEYLSHFVGDSFAGAISSVTSFGVFIQLDHLFVEGLLHISDLGDDYFHYDPVKHLMQGERSGKMYRLGDRVVVQVAKVNLDDRKIEFSWPNAVRKTDGKPSAYQKMSKKIIPKQVRTPPTRQIGEGFAPEQDSGPDGLAMIRDYMGASTQGGEEKKRKPRKRRHPKSRKAKQEHHE
jgi:ribonuclease R